MKNIIKLSSILFLLFCCFNALFAQIPNIIFSQDTLSLLVTTADSDGNGDSTCNLDLVLTNESSESIPIKWKKRVLTNSQDTWKFHVCDDNACYSSEIDSALVTLTQINSQDPLSGWSAITLGFDDNLNTIYEGYAEVELTVSLANDPDVFSKIIFIFDGQGITSAVVEEKSISLALYPNPSQGFLSISGDLSFEATQALVYDMNGQMVLKANCKKDEVIDINNLVTGMYVVAILDRKTNVLARKLFSKI